MRSVLPGALLGAADVAGRVMDGFAVLARGVGAAGRVGAAEGRTVGFTGAAVDGAAAGGVGDGTGTRSSAACTHTGATGVGSIVPGGAAGTGVTDVLGAAVGVWILTGPGVSWSGAVHPANVMTASSAPLTQVPCFMIISCPVVVCQPSGWIALLEATLSRLSSHVLLRILW